MYLVFPKEFALTKKEDSDVKEQDEKETVMEESDLDSEDLKVFYPTNQWQVVYPGKLNTVNYLHIMCYSKYRKRLESTVELLKL